MKYIPTSYTLRKRDGKLFLCKDGKEIAEFVNPSDEDTANTVCNVLCADEDYWNRYEEATHPEGNR